MRKYSALDSSHILMAYTNTKKPGKSLAWSNTRISLLEHCERKYFFNYYTFILREDFPEEWKETLVLKGLKSIEMWVGEKSHFLLSDYLHALQAGEMEVDTITSLKDTMKAEMEADFAFSKMRDYQNDEDFFGKFGLSEHFYGEDVDAELPLAIEKVCGNLDRFIASSWHSKVQDCFERAKMVYVESPREPDFEAMRVNISKIPALRGISVMASPDFGAIFSDTEYLIIDWKSGKEDVLQEGISDQLKVYALKMLLKKGYTSLQGVRIEAYEVYLNTMTAYGGVLKQEDIDGVVAKIEKDVELQKDFLVDKNPILNLPVEKDMFRKTTNAKKCENCTFRSVCGKL